MKYKDLHASEVDAFLAQEKCLVLDYRDEANHLADHLPGAKMVNDGLIMQLTRKNKDIPVLVYCYHGNSSRDLSELLVNFGLSDVYNLVGGWQAWENFRSTSKTSPSIKLRVWLVDQGFDEYDINGRIKHGITPLMQAALLAEQQYLEELIALGANINALNDDGNNALWFASVSECIECIEYLLAHGIEINHSNSNGASSLIYAASSGKFSVVKTLVESGADLCQSTLDGFTALDSASTLPILKFLKQQSIAA